MLICLRNGTPWFDQFEFSPVISDVMSYLDHLWLQTLELFNGDAISRAVANPIEFVLPLGFFMALETAEYLQGLTSTYERARDKLPTLLGSIEQRDYPKMMRHTQVLLKDIRFALRSLRKLQDCPSKKPLIEDFESLLECTLELHEMVKDSLTDQVATLSLEASRQSIAESKKVNRFTLVAWVFIPVSLISSVFGMNLAELSPGPPISLFFEIAGPVVVAALILE